MLNRYKPDIHLSTSSAEHPEVTNGRETLRKQPKKKTAFNLYVEDQHQDLTKKTTKDAFTLLRKQWKELSADDQLPWLQAAEEKQREIIMVGYDEMFSNLLGLIMLVFFKYQTHIL